MTDEECSEVENWMDVLLKLNGEKNSSDENEILPEFR